MAEESKAFLRSAALIALGLIPALAGLFVAPSRGNAVIAAGSASMAIAFVLWTQRLAAQLAELRHRDTEKDSELSNLQEATRTQARELRDARTHDAATGALNRGAFLRRLEETIARDARMGKALTFLLVDVEGFKTLNIERGRIGGDAILARVAHALADATRGTDWVGRLGGDEFGVVLNECDDPGPAVNRIFTNLDAGAAGESSVAVRVAVGAVVIDKPASGFELSELFRVAETALASVRGSGGNLCARRALAGASERQSATA